MKTATQPTGRKATEAQAEPLRSHVLAYSWTISRGRDTYGYNLLTLREDGNKAASACGGGYDMTGSALGDWVAKAYPVRLLELARRLAGSVRVKTEDPAGWRYVDRTAQCIRISSPKGQRFDHYEPNPDHIEGALHGLTYYPDTDKATLDGGAGQRAVEECLKTMGLTFREDRGNWNQKTGRRRDHGIYTIAPTV